MIEKLLDQKSSFTFDELETVLGSLVYELKKSGKTSGSRRAYYNEESDYIIRIHKPHPSNELKKYVKALVIKELKEKNLI